MEEMDELIERVLHLPEEVSRPCLVPLTKVGFTHGRLIHTNEFHISNEQDEITGVLSHTQAAAYLRELQSPGGNTVNVVNTDNVKSDIKDIPLKGILKTSREKINERYDGDAINQFVGSNDNDMHENVGIFEISELLDDNDNIVSHEVINVNDQMKSLEKAVSVAKEKVGDDDERGKKMQEMLNFLNKNHVESSNSKVSEVNMFENQV
jgi:hypothetical protein